MGYSLSDLLDDQIYHNMMLKKNNPYALPVQTVVGSGQAQISNQLILPSFSSNLHGIFAGMIGVQNQNQWQQSWSITAVSDPGDLQRLDALYSYANASSEILRLPNGDRISAICAFVDDYSAAVLNTSGQGPVRLSDLPLPPVARHSDNKIADDFDVIRSRMPNDNADPKPLWGPPVTAPIPPLSAIRTCHVYPMSTYADLHPDLWPVPFPDIGFLSLAARKRRVYPARTT